MIAKNVSLQSTTDGRHHTDPLLYWIGKIKVLVGGSENTKDTQIINLTVSCRLHNRRLSTATTVT